MSVYRTYQKLLGVEGNFGESNAHVQLTGEAASALIRQKLEDDKPVMIGRYGSTELSIVLNYLLTKGNIFQNAANVIKGVPYFSRYKKGLLGNFRHVCGFFPIERAQIDRFSELYIADSAELDVLGSWLGYEKYIFPILPKDLVRVHLEDLSPFIHQHPWSKALEGKKVLVVHPFEQSIITQYGKREKLFTNKDVLPEFELKTVKAVQSYANATTQFKDWFEALDSMTQQIANTDFDIAILGCGGYGLPLAATIKRMGKKSIHIGGATQCMFGIKGKRWELPIYDYQNRYYNEYWIRPNEQETPKEAIRVEGATYW